MGLEDVTATLKKLRREVAKGSGPSVKRERELYSALLASSTSSRSWTSVSFSPARGTSRRGSPGLPVTTYGLGKAKQRCDGIVRQRRGRCLLGAQLNGPGAGDVMLGQPK